MPHRVWRPNIGGIRHTVLVRWNPWTFDGELIVDGPVTKTWGARVARPDITLEIDGHPAFLRNDLAAFELFVDGEKVYSTDYSPRQADRILENPAVSRG